MSKNDTKVVGITLTKQLLLIHYIKPEEESKVDEYIAAVKWKANPTLAKLVQAFAEVVSNYVIGNNKSVENISILDMEQLFKDLLSGEDT